MLRPQAARTRRSVAGAFVMPFLLNTFGLTLRADRRLHPLRPAASGTPIDVEIAAGPVPDALDRCDIETCHWSATEREHLLCVPGVGRFLIAEGCRIRYAASMGADERVLDAYILGSCLGAILHQRGRSVLHGAAVMSHGRAFAICGKSGAGKSTMAAHLLAHGALLLSDDLTVVTDTAAPAVLPGYPQSKLTPEALGRLGNDWAGLEPAAGDRGKLAVPRAASFCDSHHPLAGIFIIERSDVAEPKVVRLTPAQALEPLLRHTYRRHYLAPSRAERHLSQWAHVARQVPAFLIVRPRDTDSTGFAIPAIRERIAQLAPAALEPAL